MATSKEYMDYILDQLSGVEGITHRKMMGEYILYIHGRIAAYVCDDRLLVSRWPQQSGFCRMLPWRHPIPGPRRCCWLRIRTIGC